MGEDQNLTMNQSGHLFGLAQDQSGAQNQSGELDRQEQPDQLDQMPYMQHMTTILVILHLSVFVSGLVGNSLVCLSVYRNKSLQTVTNYYIVNLAVADFLVILICLPPTVYWDLTLTWNFGLIPCKLVLYLQSTSVSVSVLTLTCISIDRWYAICRPLEFSSTKYRAKVTIGLIWLLSLLIGTPDLIFLTLRPIYEENNHVYMDCTHSWPESSARIYQLCIVTLLFIFPFVLMSISYWHIVNVLWRNETMAESCQNSIKQQESSASVAVSHQPDENLEVPSEELAGSKSELPSQVQINPPPASATRLDSRSQGGSTVVLCLLVVDKRPSRVEPTRADTLAGLDARSCVNGASHSPNNRHVSFSSSAKSTLIGPTPHGEPLPVDGGSAGSGRSGLCNSDCFVCLIPCRSDDKFIAKKTSRRYRKNLANYAARQAKFTSQDGGPSRQHPQHSPRLQPTSATDNQLPSIINRPGEPSDSSATYRVEEASLSGINNSCGELSQPSEEIGKGRSPRLANIASNRNQAEPGSSTGTLLQTSSHSSATNPSINNNATRYCKLIESRKKAAKMLIVIVIMFGLCYLPVHFLNTLRYTVGLNQNNMTTIASLVSHWLCYFNSAINPLIYNLMSGKFRHEFANLFFCKCFRRQPAGF